MDSLAGRFPMDEKVKSKFKSEKHYHSTDAHDSAKKATAGATAAALMSGDAPPFLRCPASIR